MLYPAELRALQPDESWRGDGFSQPRFFSGFAVTGEVGEAVSPAEGAASGGGPRQTVGDGGLQVGPGRGRIGGFFLSRIGDSHCSAD
jgi:hypothetical protein